MDKIYLTIIFSLALFGTFYFVGRFLTWVAWKISPHNFDKEFTRSDIYVTNIVGVISTILWTVIFYFAIN